MHTPSKHCVICVDDAFYWMCKGNLQTQLQTSSTLSNPNPKGKHQLHLPPLTGVYQAELHEKGRVGGTGCWMASADTDGHSGLHPAVHRKLLKPSSGLCGWRSQVPGAWWIISFSHDTFTNVRHHHHHHHPPRPTSSQQSTPMIKYSNTQFSLFAEFGKPNMECFLKDIFFYIKINVSEIKNNWIRKGRSADLNKGGGVS